ncbi:MAG: DUF1343 domain-containing protein [Bacteroidales bacterium]|jgi:uncharacterized protein YbbC (DUF1343 family)
MKNKIKILVALVLISAAAFSQQKIVNTLVVNSKLIKVGAERTSEYLPLLKDKNVAIVANQTSLVKNTHIVDTLLKLGIKINKVFSPEHGFRGNFDAGESVTDLKDEKTGIQIISLYGKKTKPTKEDLADIDVVVFDIQDVGVRFYTYLSTLEYTMEACAENKIKLIVLDRPNPNGYFIDGPVLEKEFSSFLGLHPIPLVYGMTIAEYAQMLNGEGWLKNNIKCDLTCIKCDGYNHRQLYQLPVPPSPNLPNMESVYLYPSIGLFEGTLISVGRGTDLSFNVIGHPALKEGSFSFTPQSIPGKSKNPPYEGKKCNGFKLTEFAESYIKNSKQLYLYWLINIYDEFPDKANFFNSNFNFLAGNSKLKMQLQEGVKKKDIKDHAEDLAKDIKKSWQDYLEKSIRDSWQDDIKKFKLIRKKYILYSDFE